jgi:hypothetical protein
MKWLVKLTLLLSLSSCSAQWHLKKAIKKEPSILQADTISVTDTLVLPPVAMKDTVIIEQHDTITLVKERLRVEIIKSNDTITIDAVCDSDTIIRVVEVPYEKVVYSPKAGLKEKVWSWIIGIAVGIIGMNLIGKRR